MARRVYTEVAWLFCNQLGAGRAYGVTNDGRSFAVFLTQNGWVDTIAGDTYGPFADADSAINDLQLRLAAERILVRRRG